MRSRTSQHLGKHLEPGKQDIAYLEELYKEFRAPNAPDVHAALQLLQERYTAIREALLDGARDEQDTRTSESDDDADDELDGLSREELDEWILSAKVRWVKDMHEIMYDGILWNAGQFRSKHDKEDGHVWFGGHDPRRRGHGRFRGCAPDRIEEELKDVLSILDYSIVDERKALWAACLFYQQFVYCHPFYDANGRIGRLVVTSFLADYGVGIRWEEMENTNVKFLKYLNKAHTVFSSEDMHPSNEEKYLEYMVYLFRYIEKYKYTLQDDEDLVDRYLAIE